MPTKGMEFFMRFRGRDAHPSRTQEPAAHHGRPAGAPPPHRLQT